MEQEKDILAKAKRELEEKKELVAELTEQHRQAMETARQNYDLDVIAIRESFEVSLAGIENQRKEVEKKLLELDNSKSEATEKKKLALADAQVNYQRILDEIEAKY